MSRGPDAATLLKRTIERSADAAGCEVSVRLLDTTRWASATFAGARHALVLSVRDDPAAARWLGALAEADLPMRGHLVADLVTRALTRRSGQAIAEIEALTVET